jgi:GxxExxY protein
MYSTKNEINKLCYEILRCAIEVHRVLGPGLLESIYEKCMIFELEAIGFEVRSQIEVPLLYKGHFLETRLKLDLLVEDIVIVELKSVEAFIPINSAQIISHLNLMAKPKGILINFNSTNIMKEGQKTFVTQRFADLTDGY